MNSDCNDPLSFSVQPISVVLLTPRQRRVKTVAEKLVADGMPDQQAEAAAERAQRLVDEINAQKVFENPFGKSSL